MPKRRKIGNKHTTISITWEDKEKLRKFAVFKKDTKNGKLYQSDAEVIHWILGSLAEPSNVAHSTYPTI